MNVYEARSAGRDYCNTEGSDHYKGGIEPLDLMISLGIHEDFCIGNMLKYARRFKKTRNLDDLKKVSDYSHILCGVEIGKHNEKTDIIEQRIIADEQMEAEQRETHEHLVERAKNEREDFCNGVPDEKCIECCLRYENNGMRLDCKNICKIHPQLALDLMQGKVGE